MKFLISEDQLNYEKLSDMFYKMIESTYPDMYDTYNEGLKHTDTKSEKDGELLYYYNWKEKSFHISLHMVNEVYESFGLPILNWDFISNNREIFNDFIIVFAKRHYGYDVKSVFRHWY